jgi:hypothetical protein
VLNEFNDEAVLDKETGLVWEQSPGERDRTATRVWRQAQRSCNTSIVGNRLGWRLSTIQELASLVDPTQSNPALPSGHPFSNVQLFQYWSATTDVGSNGNVAWFVNLASGAVSNGSKSNPLHVWCVRGGQGVDPQ